jgi:hypothetical protein
MSGQGSDGRSGTDAALIVADISPGALSCMRPFGTPEQTTDPAAEGWIAVNVAASVRSAVVDRVIEPAAILRQLAERARVLESNDP